VTRKPAVSAEAGHPDRGPWGHDAWRCRRGLLEHAGRRNRYQFNWLNAAQRTK